MPVTVITDQYSAAMYMSHGIGSLASLLCDMYDARKFVIQVSTASSSATRPHMHACQCDHSSKKPISWNILSTAYVSSR
eukprot:4501166-Prymnesium_polylepis.1